MPERGQLLLGLVALEHEVVARRTEAVLRAIGVVEVAVGRADVMVVVAPAGPAIRLLERLDPRVGLEGPGEEHPGPDLVLADVLAVRRDHRIEAEVLLHLHDGAHRIVDPELEQVEERLVGLAELLDQRQPEPAVKGDPVRRPPLEGDSCAFGGLHGSSLWLLVGDASRQS